MKVLDKRKLKKEEYRKVCNEIEIHKNIQHPSIVKVFIKMNSEMISIFSVLNSKQSLQTLNNVFPALFCYYYIVAAGLSYQIDIIKPRSTETRIPISHTV